MSSPHRHRPRLAVVALALFALAAPGAAPAQEPHQAAGPYFFSATRALCSR